jgi:hypothetical protein
MKGREGRQDWDCGVVRAPTVVEACEFDKCSTADLF